MGSAQKYLQPKVVNQLKNIELKAKYIVEGFISGLHESPYYGFSSEFSEYRRYNKGDDISHIDWKVYARTDKYYIKKFQAETNMEATLLMDMSESMAYKYNEKNMSKLEYASCLAASIGYMMIGQQDPVGMITFNEAIQRYVPPKGKRSHLFTLFGEMERRAPFGQTDIPKSLHIAAEAIKHRGLVIIFSDLLQMPKGNAGNGDGADSDVSKIADIKEVLQALHHVKFKGHDIILFHVLDEAEVKFPFEKVGRFIDPETDERLELDPRSVKKRYLELISDFQNKYKADCATANIDYVPLDTSTPFYIPLITYLRHRISHY